MKLPCSIFAGAFHCQAESGHARRAGALAALPVRVHNKRANKRAKAVSLDSKAHQCAHEIGKSELFDEDVRRFANDRQSEREKFAGKKSIKRSLEQVVKENLK